MKNFNFKKRFGQNFLSDTNLLKGICSDAQILPDDEVLEVGAGAGALTRELCHAAKRVVAFEIDHDLKPVLEGLGEENLTLVFEDVLKVPTKQIDDMFDKSFKLVANLPYYITSPIIFKFLKESEKLFSLTVMVQKEVGARMVAKPGSKDYGLLSASCAFFGEPKILRNVSRKMFFPAPEVDSCIVGMKIERKKFDISADSFFEVAKACFKSRRKTLLNNLVEAGYKKAELAGLDFDLSRRAETLDAGELVCLAKLLASLSAEEKSK